MTIDELQELVDRNGFSINYIGRSSEGRRKKPYACQLSPLARSPHWRRDEINIRGVGESYQAAIDDALQQLSQFLIERLDPH